MSNAVFWRVAPDDQVEDILDEAAMRFDSPPSDEVNSDLADALWVGLGSVQTGSGQRQVREKNQVEAEREFARGKPLEVEWAPNDSLARGGTGRGTDVGKI